MSDQEEASESIEETELSDDELEQASGGVPGYVSTGVYTGPFSFPSGPEVEPISPKPIEEIDGPELRKPDS